MALSLSIASSQRLPAIGGPRNAATALADVRPRLSLVISTVDRSTELLRLFDSLEDQSFTDFEVIVVDQNEDDRVAEVIGSRPWNFRVCHVRSGGARGLSRGRNVGWRLAQGEVLLFPDDDCWYPPDFLSHGLSLLWRARDVVCGRAADTDGRSVNARYAKFAHEINATNVWISQMEWATFIRRPLLEALGGYDEALGVGAPTPWQAAEGPDLIIRALEYGARCHFDPALAGFHEEIDTRQPNRAVTRKGRAYARGMGFVLRKHAFGPAWLAYWVSRSMFNSVRHLVVGDIPRARFYFQVACGRIEGWTMHTLGRRRRKPSIGRKTVVAYS